MRCGPVRSGRRSRFTSPIANPANLLVMGSAGYRFADYVRASVPLTLVVFLVLILLTAVLWLL